MAKYEDLNRLIRLVSDLDEKFESVPRQKVFLDSHSARVYGYMLHWPLGDGFLRVDYRGKAAYVVKKLGQKGCVATKEQIREVANAIERALKALDG